MGIISLIGIVLGVFAFAFLAIKRVNLFFNGMVASVIVILFSGLPLLETIDKTWMTGFQAYIKTLALVLILSAIFGYFMEDCGAIRKIALTLAKLARTSKSLVTQQFMALMILPLLYFLLTYFGISAMVIVFTVLGIGRDMFRELNIPWRFYCYGSTGIYFAYILGGSVSTVNVAATKSFGGNLTDGFLLSLILVIIGAFILCFLALADIKQCQKNQEGYLPSAAAIEALQLKEPLSEDKLPSIIRSFIPFITPLLLLAFFKINVLTALTAGILVCLALNFKRYDALNKTLSTAIIAAAPVILNVAGASAFAYVVRDVAGFKLITTALANVSPLVAALGSQALISMMCASGEATMTSSGDFIAKNMAQTGMSIATAKTLSKVGLFTYSMPHTAAYVNSLTLTKIPYGQGILVYMKTTYLPGIVMLVVGLILRAVGLF